MCVIFVYFRFIFFCWSYNNSHTWNALSWPDKRFTIQNCSFISRFSSHQDHNSILIINRMLQIKNKKSIETSFCTFVLNQHHSIRSCKTFHYYFYFFLFDVSVVRFWMWFTFPIDCVSKTCCVCTKKGKQASNNLTPSKHALSFWLCSIDDLTHLLPARLYCIYAVFIFHFVHHSLYIFFILIIHFFYVF